MIEAMLDRKGPDEKGLRWIPFAKIEKQKMKTRGKYEKGYPSGAVVHYTAGQQSIGSDALSWGREECYCFLLIDAIGTIYQAHPIDEWGSHAGKSSYHGIDGTVSNKLIGIEISCAGLLEKVVTEEGTKFKAWFHKNSSQYFGAAHVNYIQAREGCISGYYHKYTPAQESSLIYLLKWLKSNDPVGCFNYDLVLGHSEVSPLRKTDPGGSLSMSMHDLRSILKGDM